MHKRIAILASGGGSNAEKILAHFQQHDCARVDLIACNRKEAGVYNHAETYGIDTFRLTRANFYESDEFIQLLKSRHIDFVVLAGFLWFIPQQMVHAFENRMVNIHPGLLPKYGGKGMYGHHVHEAVKAAGERESGMTIHWVNEAYDEGNIIFQDRVALDPDDSPDDIARKVLMLEHRNYARVVEEVLCGDQ
ncbi:MAG: phosphoribosylglycinamide formyltransferase [Flavobacteriales bacterium]|nr:phosphoribosylglycinamide formyltransferase [Flavobacteriales bacterium]